MAKPDVTANSPTAGSIAWAAFNIQYQGVSYSIPAGSTAERWVWWRYNTGGSTTVLEAGPAVPADLTDDDVLLLSNKNGLPIRVQSTSYVDGELLVDGTILADALGTDSVTTRALAAQSVGAEQVNAEVMVANEVYAREGIQVQQPGGLAGIRLDENGFLQLNNDGAARVNFPADPSLPNLVRSELITDGITAQGRVALRGVDNEVSRNSAITLQVGTTAPANSPSISTGFSLVKLGGLPDGGLFTRASDGASWKFITGGNTNAATITTLTDAGAISTTAVSGLPSGLVIPPARQSDIARIGSSYYIVGLATSGGVSNVPHIVELNSSMAYVRHFPIATTGTYTSRIQTVASDGTNLYTLLYDVNADKNAVTRISATTGAIAATTVLSGRSYGSASGSKLQGVGNFDYGSSRFVLLGSVGYVDTHAADGTYQTAERWSATGVQAWAWSGSRWFTSQGGSLRTSSSNRTARTIYAAYTWFDSDGSDGANFETPASPIVSFVQPARQSISITTPPPADDGTPQSPDSARFYVGVSATTLKLQALASPYVLNAFVGTATYLDVDPAAGAAIPTTNTFPDGTAALIKSRSGTSVMRGDGTWQWGPLIGSSSVAQVTTDPVNPTDIVNLRTLTNRVVLTLSPTGTLTLTSATNSQVPGMVDTFVSPGPNAVFLVTGSVDFSQTAGSAAIARALLGIDGTAASPTLSSAQALMRSTTNIALRATSVLSWIVSGLTAGTHTLRLVASLTAAGSGWDIQTQSRVTLVQIA